ncbi:hypothetical protein Btru_006138 [Bulinus truncatus]|nr:hypothetical protein Btru_006138 [Bulinus truncatus]
MRPKGGRAVRLHRLVSVMDDDEVYISKSLVIGIYISIIATCFLGNFVVILIVALRPVLHTSTGYFLLSLSVADLFVGVVVVSLTLAHKLNYEYAAGMGRMACVIPPYLELTCITASVYSLLCVSIDRYRAIVLARKPSSDSFIFISFLVVWVGSFLYSAKVFLQDYLTVNSGDPPSTDSNSTSGYLTSKSTDSNVDNFSLDTSFCSLLVEEDTANLPFRVADLIVLFLVPVAAMTYILIQIRHRLWGSSVGVTTNVMRKRAVIRFLAVDIVIFVLCWLPFYMTDIISDSVKIVTGKPEDVDENEVYSILRFCFIILALSNSFLNPLIYAFFNKNFLNEARALLIKNRLCHCFRNKVWPTVTEETQGSAVPDVQVLGAT